MTRVLRSDRVHHRWMAHLAEWGVGKGHLCMVVVGTMVVVGSMEATVMAPTEMAPHHMAEVDTGDHSGDEAEAQVIVEVTMMVVTGVVDALAVVVRTVGTLRVLAIEDLLN